MKRDALAFFRILPAGAADIGDDVSREDLRRAGAGDWFLKLGNQDDVGCLFDEVPDFPERPPEIPEEYDVPVATTDEAPKAGEKVVEVRFKGVG